MQNEGEIRVFNPSKEISKEVVLDVLIRHRDALKQARTGELVGVEVEKIRDNDRILHKVRALGLIISAQREMITISRPITNFRSMQKWKKKYKEDEDKEKNPFEKFECDYNKLIELKNLLVFLEDQIEKAEKTKKLDDDFMIIKQTSEGDVFQLTKNFKDMLEELEDSYEQIYLLMLTNKVVSAGIEEDEEQTYKEKEQEAIRRVVEA